MRGIILAGGTGSRLHPLTLAVSKQLLPVHDKPMIYYPLATLIRAGVREVLVITTPQEAGQFRRLLGDGSRLGIEIGYAVQPSPDGLAQALLIGADHVGDEPVVLALGDNLVHGAAVDAALRGFAAADAALVLAAHVDDASAYGVVELDADGRALSLAEKPRHPRSGYAVPGLYCYAPDAVAAARALVPSARGELEITDLNRHYLERGRLRVEVLPPGTTWHDIGTVTALEAAGREVRDLQEHDGVLIGSPEEAAWRRGLVSDDELRALAAGLSSSGYGARLLALLG